LAFSLSDAADAVKALFFSAEKMFKKAAIFAIFFEVRG
jgi:hypothetical protein